jgi:CRISPR-associated Csx11 family protein
MTDFQPANQLQKFRPLMLACEAIGWLHMAGKAKMDFLRGHGGEDSEYDYKDWCKKESPPFPWHDLLAWVKNGFHRIDGKEVFWPSTFSEFLKKHAGNGGCGTLGLLQAGHAMASGIEKNIPKSTSEYLNQDITHMWRSSAFGNPERNLLEKENPPEILTDAGWKQLLKNIETLLQELEALGNPAIPHTPEDLAGWWKWREGAVGDDGWLRRDFSSTLAETRLPNNDVTLFDQSYVAAALFKSAVAGAVLEGESFPWNDKLKQKTRWRLYTVGICADYFEARAVKIGDWTGARKTLDDFFTDVRKLLEVELALGSLLYRDESVLVFSFPGERTEPKEKDSDDSERKSVFDIAEWKKFLRNKIDGYARERNLEIPPYLEISKSSRSLVKMAKEISKAKKTMRVPFHRDWGVPGNTSGGGHVCPVCQMRRSESPDDKKLGSKQKTCAICGKRRTHRLDSWLHEKGKSDSIWISEVADRNDRVALITMSLDILPWLDGSRLDSCRSQAIVEWRKYNLELSEFWQRDKEKRKTTPNPVQPELPFQSLQEEIRKRLDSFDKDDLLLCNLQEGFRHESAWDTFYSKIVEDRSDAPKWDSLKDDKDKQAAWLAHQLFCKLASPGRIYRFQRQTQEFFRSLLSWFREIAAAEKNRWRTLRLLLEPAPGANMPWRETTPYSGRIGDSSVDLLWSKELQGFITIFNLDRVLKASESKEALLDKTIPLKSDENERVGALKVENVGELPEKFGHLGAYNPIIPLELSPLRFRVVVPLDAASECIDQAVSAWNEQFSRVWDRLSLNAGVVAFSRTTPFQSVIEALRHVEEDLASEQKTETWRLADCETKGGSTALHFKSLDAEPQEFLQMMPHTLPDGRKDVFYPYLAVEDSEVRFPLDFRHPDRQVYRHVTDLRPGDGMKIQASGIRTLFLDSAGKRFERQPRYLVWQWKQMRELWHLIETCVPSQTALQGAWAELTARQEDWQSPAGTWLEDGREAWMELARAVFFHRLGVRGAALETLVQAAGSGLLGWCLEWNVKVLKKQISGGDV